MYKIFVKGNYFYVERLSDNRLFEGHKKNVLVSSLTETSDDFYFWNINGTINCDNVLNIADLVDENSIAFTVATFREFIEENTGNFNSGVPAALNGPFNRLINYFAADYTDLTTNVALTPVDGELAIVRNAQGTSWLPYNLGGTYFPKGGYIYDGANWIPQTDLITQQLEINVDDINGLETDVANHVGDLNNPHSTDLQKAMDAGSTSTVATNVEINSTAGTFKAISGSGLNKSEIFLLPAGMQIGVTTPTGISEFQFVGGLNKFLDTRLNRGLEYAGLYWANYSDRSLVDKGYVDNEISNIPAAPVDSVNGKTGIVVIDKTDVGLSNVDNTSDANKPISNATQTALNAKEDAFTKNTAFNKDFGTTAGTVLEGDKNAAIVLNTAKVTNATHSGDVVGSTALTISNNVVTNAKLATVPTQTIKGRNTAGTGNVEDLSIATLQSMLGVKVTKAGLVAAVTFAGNPKKATVTFGTAFADANYSPSIVSNTNNNTSFAPIVENITAAGFTINMSTNNINDLIDVRWIAIKH